MRGPAVQCSASMEKTRQETAGIYFELAKWTLALMLHICGDWESDVEKQNLKGIREKLLENPNVPKIRPAHSKIRQILKAFKLADETVELSALEENFQETLKQLDEALAFGLKTVATQLGCIYLYTKIPSERKIQPKRELFKELKQLWRDARAPMPDNKQARDKEGWCIPMKLIEHISAAVETE